MLGPQGFHKRPGQQRDIPGPLSERRHAQGHHPEAVVEIGSKGPLAHGLGQVPIGGGNEANVQLQRGVSPDSHDFPVLQKPQQLHLHLRRHLPYLIQEERSPLGHFQLAQTPLSGSGKGAGLVAEQFALQQGRAECCAVQRQEIPVSARAALMNGLGHQVFAGAAFTQQQNGGAGGRYRGHLLQQIPHDRRTAQNPGGGTGTVPAGVARRPCFGRPALEDLSHPVPQLEQIQRLQDVVVGPQSHGLHRGLHRPVAGHHQDTGLRIDGSHRPEQVHAGHPRHLQVGDDQVELLEPVQLSQGCLAVLIGHHLVTHSLQGTGDRSQAFLLVVDHRNGMHSIHWVGSGLHRQRLRIPMTINIPQKG